MFIFRTLIVCHKAWIGIFVIGGLNVQGCFIHYLNFHNGLASLGLLSYSATSGMTLQFPCMLRTCANFGGLPVVSHPRVQPRVSASLHNLEHFFTLSHSLPLHDSHLNIGLLIAKIQANLARNKANKMVDKIQPYTSQTYIRKKKKKKKEWKKMFIKVSFTVKFILVQGHVVQPLICPTCRNTMYKIQYHSI